MKPVPTAWKTREFVEVSKELVSYVKVDTGVTYSNVVSTSDWASSEVRRNTINSVEDSSLMKVSMILHVI